ncbi:MAG: methyltransferase [Methanomicrobiaceae archaeon]|nr:methyltransferase [Methanomicrobiaceae archaeon]
MSKKGDKETDTDQADFDVFVDKYDAILKEDLSLIAKSNELHFFPQSKADILKQITDRMNIEPENILEYGCGIGNNLSFIKNKYPHSKIFGCDVSEKSLEVSRERYPDMDFFVIGKNNEMKDMFDVILVPDVFHHIEPEDHKYFLDTISSYLRKNGIVVVLEHNPYNPVTQHIVRNCSLDKNATLLSLKYMKSLFISSGYSACLKGYFMFFPPKYQKLSPLERYIQKIPFGAKYFVSFEKKSNL